MTRLIQVIETDLERRGVGVVADPVRSIRQYYAPDGELLAERDEWLEDLRNRTVQLKEFLAYLGGLPDDVTLERIRTSPAYLAVVERSP